MELWSGSAKNTVPQTEAHTEGLAPATEVGGWSALVPSVESDHGGGGADVTLMVHVKLGEVEWVSSELRTC